MLKIQQPKRTMITTEEKTRYNALEKQIIVSMQSIMNARERVSRARIGELSYYIDQLPPYRALVIYGHALNAISERMDEDDPYKSPLKNMGRTITQTMGQEFTEAMDDNPDFYYQQKDIIANNLTNIAKTLRRVAKEA